MTKPILLCLHGWGGSKESFTELRTALKGVEIDILTPDLPGFGDEPDPKKPYTVDDYADWVDEWLRDQRPETRDRKLFLLGHSHGGRIAIKLAHRACADPTTYFLQPTDLFLCAAAGIRHKRHFKRIVGLVLAKGGKIILSIPGLNRIEAFGKKILYKLFRVHDYEKASEVMRKTLINVSKEDLRPLLKTVTIPTNIFWGTDDGMTPYGDAKVMETEIPSSTLHTFPGIRHRVHRDKAQEIADVIKERLQKL